MRTKIFTQTPRRGRQVLLSSLLSLVLFWMGLHGWGQAVETKLLTLVSPLHYAVDAPAQGVRWLLTSAKTQRNLLTENAKLRAHQLLLESKLQRLLALQRENQQLRALKHSAQHLTASVQVARLLAVSLDPTFNEWLINSGSKQGVYLGQPVLDAYGVVGQVVSTGANTAKVLLLTDRKGAIPVQNARTGERAIAIGQGGGSHILLKDLEKTADVRSGDWYISSGLAQHFPFGYPVGRVELVGRDSSRRFLSANLRVAAHLRRSNELLLVKSNPRHVAASVGWRASINPIQVGSK